MTTKYPFYCIGEIDKARAARFIHSQLGVKYAWTIDKEKWGGDYLSPSFFTTKMHVFTIIINKGFII